VGEIESATCKLDHWSWDKELKSGDTLIEGLHYQLEGLIPHGLTFKAIVKSRNELELQFEGQAEEHHVNDSVDGLFFTLLQPVFLNASPKAPQEEVTKYNLHIQFGVGYALKGQVTQSDGAVTVEIKLTGETIDIDQENQKFTTQTLFEPGDVYEVRIKNHPRGRCCQVSSNARGIMQNEPIEGIEIFCEEGSWDHPNNYTDFIGTDINGFLGEHELVTSGSNPFGEIGFLQSSMSPNTNLIFDYVSTLPTVFQPNLSSPNYRSTTIPSDAQSIVSHMNDKGLSMYGWVNQDQNSNDQVYVSIVDRDRGLIIADKLTQTISPKSNIKIVGNQNNEFYIFWIENNTKIYFTYYDGKTLRQAQSLWTYGYSLNQLQVTLNNNGEALTAWTLNNPTQQLFHSFLSQGEIKTGVGINTPLSFASTSVTHFDITSGNQESRIVWSQEDPNITGQHNIYEAYGNHDQWTKPSISTAYFRSEPNPLQVLHLLHHDVHTAIVWGVLNAANDYRIRYLSRESITWENLFEVGTVATNTLTSLQASMNLHGDVLVTWAKPSGNYIYRRLFENGSWSTETQTSSFSSLDTNFMDQHESMLANNGTAFIVWEGEENDQYRLFLSSKIADETWNDPSSIGDMINPQGEYYVTSSNHFTLHASQGCGGGAIMWTQISENADQSTTFGKQVFWSKFR